jgi:hypothetical protein
MITGVIREVALPMGAPVYNGLQKKKRTLQPG